MKKREEEEEDEDEDDTACERAREIKQKKKTKTETDTFYVAFPNIIKIYHYTFLINYLFITFIQTIILVAS